MSRGSAPPRFSRSPHLIDLIAEAERLATLITGASGPDRDQLAERRLLDACRASLLLDGARPSDELDPERARTVVSASSSVTTEPGAPAAPGASHRGTWLDAMGVVSEPTDELVHALELLGVLAGFASDDLAAPLLADPLPTLAELHRRLTRGLLAADRAGAPRTTAQAVHDASIGRIIYFPSDPAAIPTELASLGAWTASTGTREHGLIASGVLHHELLRIHPFEAANGRLARATARLVLRGRGLDPAGLSTPEPALAQDPMGYHDEVARTLRRRDLTVWLERWGEAVTDGLREAARSLGVLGPTAVPFTGAPIAGRRSGAFTIADYRAEASTGPEETRAELQALLDSGHIRRVPGSRGLRFTIVSQPAG